jgi:hypothetical protein
MGFRVSSYEAFSKISSDQDHFMVAKQSAFGRNFDCHPNFADYSRMEPEFDSAS